VSVTVSTIFGGFELVWTVNLPWGACRSHPCNSSIPVCGKNAETLKSILFVVLNPRVFSCDPYFNLALLWMCILMLNPQISGKTLQWNFLKVVAVVTSVSTKSVNQRSLCPDQPLSSSINTPYNCAGDPDTRRLTVVAILFVVRCLFQAGRWWSKGLSQVDVMVQKVCIFLPSYSLSLRNIYLILIRVLT